MVRRVVMRGSRIEISRGMRGSRIEISRGMRGSRIEISRGMRGSRIEISRGWVVVVGYRVVLRLLEIRRLVKRIMA
jgi:hypothetical protein